MICPRCGSDTSVFETRQTEDGFVRRRRLCEAGHRFTTWESSYAPAQARWARKNGTAKVAAWRAKNPEKAAALRERERLRRAARAEAAETGEPVKTIYERWGVL